MKTLKKHATHAITGFELSKKVLNNLYNFNLKPTAKLVLLYLCDCYNPQHGEMFPKQSTIAKKLGISEVSVIRAIQELHKEGLIISERKYTNRYRFTSKIVSEGVIFEEKEMIVETYQNEKETIKMKPHEHEQINETNKPTNVDDFKILKNYAESKGAKNVTAYINALKNNGSADKIIKDFKEKEAADRYFARQIKETEERNAQNRIWIAENPQECETLKEVLLKNWGIKK